MISRNIGYANGDPRNAEGVVRLAGEDWRLRPEAAGALRALNTEYRQRFGEDIRPLETMRSLETQQHYYALYQAGRGNLAAVPGTSNHGWGLAADLAYPLDRTSTEQHKWLVNAAPAYGWCWAGRHFSQVEPWHIEFDGDHLTAEQASRFRADGLTPTQAAAIAEEEDDMGMCLIRNEKSGEIRLVNMVTGKSWQLPDYGYVHLWVKFGAMPLQDLPENQYRHFLQMAGALGAKG